MIDLINQLVDENYPGVVLRIKSGTAWIVLEHHKYLDYKNVKLARLGKISLPDGYTYVSEKITSFKTLTII